MSGELVLLRHGESDWNAGSRFTGWVDVALTERGRSEATTAGELLEAAGILPDVVHTSVLRRAITTAQLALDSCDRHWVPAHRSWRLNERHYGTLQGQEKRAVREAVGDREYARWRRSYDAPPPPIGDDEAAGQESDPRYADVAALPRSESLADVLVRLLPHWHNEIAPKLRAGKTVLVVAHSNSLRALIKHLDGISDEAIVEVNVPIGIPLHYHLDESLRPVSGGTYLDPARAAAGIEAVANQGR